MDHFKLDSGGEKDLPGKMIQVTDFDWVAGESWVDSTREAGFFGRWMHPDWHSGDHITVERDERGESGIESIGSRIAAAVYAARHFARARLGALSGSGSDVSACSGPRAA